MNYDEPPQFRATHTHHCAEPYCTARVGCATPPDRDGDGPECPVPDDAFLCEDHRDMPPCDWCGEREGASLIDYDGDRMHPDCVTEAGR